MRRLNRTYHGEDRVTDVLSFGEAERKELMNRRTEQPKNQRGRHVAQLLSCSVAQSDHDLGELVVCPSYVKSQARRAGEPFRRELTRVLIHGTLHLLGEDHATPRQAERMFGMQEEIVRSLYE